VQPKNPPDKSLSNGEVLSKQTAQSRPVLKCQSSGYTAGSDVSLHFTINLNRQFRDKKIKPLFTLGSVYSTSASGAEQATETTPRQIFQIEHNIVKNPNWSEENQLAIYKRG